MFQLSRHTEEHKLEKEFPTLVTYYDIVLWGSTIVKPSGHTFYVVCFRLLLGFYSFMCVR